MWCIHDSTELEKRGIPTATLCSEVFVQLARFISNTKGVPSLPLVVVTHPVGGLAPAEIRAKADKAIDEVIRLLTHGQPKA